MAFWLFIGGMIGGRAFYVIEYWHERFRTDSFRETLLRVLNFPEGGLVVYGALFGGVIGGAVVHSQARLPALATFDLIAPSMAIGLALGRIGCFLNGCCYGGPTSLAVGRDDFRQAARRMPTNWRAVRSRRLIRRSRACRCIRLSSTARSRRR